jgi:uncharacterized protein YkwD
MKKSLVLLFFAMSLTTSAIAQLSWSKQQHNFGSSQIGVPLAYEFKYTNYSTNEITIAFMKSSSKSLTPQWTKETIAANEQGTILLTYTPSHEGHYNETLQIFLDDNSLPQTLSIIGTVGNPEFNNVNTPALTITKPAQTRINVFEDNQSTTSTPTTQENDEPTATTPNKPSKPTKTTTTNPTITPPTKPTTNATTTNNTTKLEKTAIAPNYVADASLNTAANANYFTEREKAMITEINLIRSNPKAYITVVEEYVKYMKSNDLGDDYYKEDIAAAAGLIAQLKSTPALSILQPSEGIYKAAKNHGEEAKKIGALEHQAPDGSFPWDRVKKFDANMVDGGENIVGGLSDIRKAVLTLLIDSGIDGQGHRAALLYPDWTHVACYEVGKIGEMPFMWLQNFGQAKPISTSTSPTKPNSSPTSTPIEPTIPVPTTDADVAYEIDTRTKPGKLNSSNTPSNTPTKPQNNVTEEGFSTENQATKPTSNTETNLIGTNNLAANITPPKKAYSAKNAAYMSNREQEMIAEINFLRMNPKGYAKIIEAYIKFMETEIKKDESASIFFNKEIKSAEELLKLLEQLQPLSRLNPHQGMYVGAKLHGEYGKSSGNLEKEGSDGAMPNNRILKYAKDMIDGDENLPNGTSNIRYSIIKLLIDKDDNNRTQRNILLNPNWDYIAIYEVGKVGNMHYWVQDFGQARPESKPMHDETTEGHSNIENNSNNEILGFATTKTFTETTIANEIQPTANYLITNEIDYLSLREQMFLREINFLRTAPKEYAMIIESYIQTLEQKKQDNSNTTTNYEEQIAAATLIKAELTKMTAVNPLKPNSDIYQVAFQHGQDCKNNQMLTHWGSDDSNIWQRLQKILPNIKDGDQCLVADTDDIRESLIFILIEHAMFNPNREIILTKPNWTIFGITEIGAVGKRTNCWVITFGEL